jgi:hypothetical protein
MTNRIIFLVKFYDEEEHADQFLSGRLLLQSLSHFREREEADSGVRGDKDEAIAAWLPRASIEFKDHPELNVRPHNLAGPVSLSFKHHNRLFAFCMTAVHTGEFDCDANGITTCPKEDLEKLRRQLQVHEKCLKFGPWAVVVDPRAFALRAKETIESKGHTFYDGLVDYYDLNTANGPFNWREIPFKKTMRFSWQQEYRIVVDAKTPGPNHLFLEIGNIQDISRKIEAMNVNASFQIDLQSIGPSAPT